MIKNKKSLVVYALITLVIAAVLVFVVFKFGGRVAEAVAPFLFGNKAEETLNKFTAEIGKIELNNQKQVFVTLDPNSAIIGFSKNSNSFKCIACGSQSKDITSSFTKPEREQCNNKPCVCLCSNAFQVDKSTTPYVMKCDSQKMICKTLDNDLVGIVELKKYVEQLNKAEPGKYPSTNAKWIGGFLFERHNRGDFVSSGLPSPQLPRFIVYAKKENINGIVYIEICPGSECSYSIPLEKEQLPANICQIMHECFDSENVRRVPGFPDSYCRPTYNPKTRQLNEDDCKKVQTCANSKVNLPSKCEPVAGVYELTFLPSVTKNI